MADSRAKTQAPEGFVGVDDLVEIYGWKKSWVYKQVQARTIPSYKMGHYAQFLLLTTTDSRAGLEARARIHGESGTLISPLRGDPSAAANRALR